MKILTSNVPLDSYTPKDVAQMTMSSDIQRMKDNVGSLLSIDKWLIYEDGEDDDVKTILSIRTAEGEIFATNSSTFQREFQRLNDLYAQMGQELDEIVIKAGTSKGGREFITCGV